MPGRKSEPGEAYQLLLDRLVRTLDAGTRNTLHVAAVLGPRLNDSALYSLADLKVSEVMTGLTTLVQFRILRDGGDHLEFSNDLVRAHAYYAVPAPMRLLLHGLIADVLLARAAEGDDSLGLEIAWHCMRCGRKEEATKHLFSGGRASIRRGAVHEAERRLESGLSSLTGDRLEEARLLLVELLQEQGRWKESTTLLAAFAEESKTLDGRCLAGRAVVEVFEITASEFSEPCRLPIGSSLMRRKIRKPDFEHSGWQGPLCALSHLRTWPPPSLIRHFEPRHAIGDTRNSNGTPSSFMFVTILNGAPKKAKIRSAGW